MANLGYDHANYDSLSGNQSVPDSSAENLYVNGGIRVRPELLLGVEAGGSVITYSQTSPANAQVTPSAVQWNAGVSTQGLSTQFISATQLTAIVPASLIATAGPVFVTVRNPDGSTSNVFTYGFSFAQHRRVRAEVYIDSGDANKNKHLFDLLFAQKEALESAMGSELAWERLDERRSSRVAVYRPGSIDAPTEELQEIQAWAITNLERFKSVFPPEIRNALSFIQAEVPGEGPD